MKKYRFWSYGALASVALMIAIAALWVLPAGAGHTAPVVGTLTVSPTAVSPDNAVDVALRTVTITVTDPNLNRPLFVGTGPDGQTATFDQVPDPDNLVLLTPDPGNGERVVVPIDTVGTFIATLIANPIVVVGGANFTPLADRNDDGAITAADLEIVVPAAGPVVAGDIQIVSIFSAERGLVTFQVNRGGLKTGDGFFDVRYATSGQELTRDTQTFTETLKAPAPGTVITGENFTSPLSNQLATNDMTFPGGEATTGDATTIGDTTVTFVAAALLNTGDQMVVEYLGIDSLVLLTDLASGDTVSMPLSITLLDTNGVGGVTVADITVVSGNVAVQAYTGSNNTAQFAATAAQTIGDAFSVQYQGRETLSVVDPGLHHQEPFNLDLKMDWLPLQDTNGDGAVSTADISISIAGRNADNLPQVTVDAVDRGAGVGGLAVSVLADLTNGSPWDDDISLIHSGDAVASGEDIKVTYLGLVDLVFVKGSNNVEIPLRMRESGPDTGVYETVVSAIDGSAGQADQPNENLDPIKSGDTENHRTRLAVIDGGAITVLYRDRSPARPITERILVEIEPPNFDNISPDDEATTNDLKAFLRAEVSDSISGVNPSGDLDANDNPVSVNVVASVDGVGQTITTGDIDVAETPAGSGTWTIEYRIDKLPQIAADIAADAEVERVIVWEIEVTDKAGNLGKSGQRTLTAINRRPTLQSVFVGDNWDATVIDDPATPEDERLRGSRPGLSGTASSTTIRVVFDIPMDGGSLSTGDFLVDGVPPLAVAFFADLSNSVFLTVAELDPAAMPKVEIVGVVQDAGGNAVDTTDPAASVIEQATDGISPTLTAAVTVTYAEADTGLTVSSNEPIVGSAPIRTINRCAGSPIVCDVSSQTFTFFTSTKIITAQQEWRFDLTAFGTPGRYNIQLTASDGTNVGTAGNADATVAGALTFEIDKALPAPTGTDPLPDDVATAVNESETSDIDPFVVEIDWSSEGTEYDGDTQTGVTLTKAILDAGTTNERNVLAQSSTTDGGRTFSIAIPGIGLGEHTLTYNGEDGLAHTLATDATLTFTVVAPPAFQISLSPGMNLVSIPGEPETGSIDAVFGTVDAVRPDLHQGG